MRSEAFALGRSSSSVRAVLLAVAAFSIVGTAHAITPINGITGLTNTGVIVDPSTLADGKWQITGGSSDPSLLPYPSPAYTDATNGSFPIPPWVQNTAISSWDTPFNPIDSVTDPSTSPGTPANGYYDYTTTFNVTATPAEISAGYLGGKFASDNEVARIVLNGDTIYTGPTNGSSQYSFWTSFGARGDLISGTNTLTFDVVNYNQYSGNPSGLDVQLSGGVPEPATWAMMLLGFAGLGFSGYRRARKTRVNFSAA